MVAVEQVRLGLETVLQVLQILVVAAVAVLVGLLLAEQVVQAS
jgi:accessory gene regulator protein AgrB